ncbi:heme A synthase [Candidatus Marinamargulisbacteria bacterium SCGC AAA071-K20]|nr:heme A synthase [Candidatus Marinamargulisbacteria bacterium SCGC AAA071-K20]
MIQYNHKFEEEKTLKNPLLSWLYTIFLLILSIILVGGITRLTNSGLSIVEWRPVFGFLPPLNSLEWDRIFLLYQKTPEFIYHNNQMDLSSFKKIFFWEYLHRVLGRIIGLVIIVGGWIIYKKGLLSKKDNIRTLVIGLLVVLQGVMGWYMVKSGLVSRPDVSHLRLSAHLGLALLLLQIVFWWILDIIVPKFKNKVSTRFLLIAKVILGVTSLQIIYGAFMAGLKAGFAFNTFPTMGGFIVPPSLFILEPVFRNFIENPIMIQFLHRGLAWILVIGVIAFHLKARKNKELSSQQQLAIFSLRITTMIQFLLGILTLIYVVPLHLALLHQIGGVLMLSSAVFTVHVFQSK